MIRLWLPKQTLLVKLISLFMFVSVLSVVITSAILSAYEINMADNAESRRLNSIAEILAPNLTASILFEDKDTARELIQPLRSQPSIVYVSVYDHTGVMFASTILEEKVSQTDIAGLKAITIPLVLEGNYYGKLTIHADYSLVDEHISFYATFVFTMLVLIIAISFIASALLSRRFVSPILALAEVAKNVKASNDYSLRARQDSNDELGDLTSYFNSMLETVQQRDKDMEQQVQERTIELKNANNQLHTQAYRDSLSALPNRRYLLEKMGSLIGYQAEKRERFALLFLDLDGFKDVNDLMGHDSGDVLILAAANRIRKAVDNNLVARLGGDEFTVLVRGYQGKEALKALAENIAEMLREPFNIHGEKVYITASIGISCYPEHGTSTDVVLKNADLAMYEAKNAGRNCYRFFEPPMLEKLQTKRRMLDDLRIAIEQDELELYYQPIVNLSNGKIEKAEALLRWNHPDQGLVSPATFIAAAEENGLINDLGHWVASSAIGSLKRLRESSQGLTLSVNVSPVQFRPGSCWLELFVDNLIRENIPPHTLAIEITENMLMSSDEQTMQKLMSIKKHGVEIAIDDFGVGYSSLSYLQKLEVDTLKIDRSFVQLLGSDLASATLCRTMVNLAKNLNIKVVAEGVETQLQSDALSRFGCDYGQGYYFARPMTLANFEQLLRDTEKDRLQRVANAGQGE